MLKIVEEALPVARCVKSRDEAVAFFKGMGEHYKAEIIEIIPADEDLSLYAQGEFIDLCRGPHVPTTDKLRAFKLMKVAGAYWRGDHNNQMLSRIYGTAWLNDKDLKAYLVQLEEAEKRDHRKIGKALDLFHHAGRGAGPGVLASQGLGAVAGGRAVHAPVYRASRATRKCAARRSSTCRCGRSPATGTTTRRTCSSPSRRSAPTRSSR